MAYAVVGGAAERTDDPILLHLKQESATHALMIVVMAVAMISGSPAVTVAGAVVLIAASMLCAALSRSHIFLREHVVDLWAMALVFLVYLPASASTGGGHAHVLQIPQPLFFAAVVVLWLGARVGLARVRGQWRMSLLSAVVTGAGLAIMAAFCA